MHPARHPPRTVRPTRRSRTRLFDLYTSNIGMLARAWSQRAAGWRCLTLRDSTRPHHRGRLNLATSSSSTPTTRASNSPTVMVGVIKAVEHAAADSRIGQQFFNECYRVLVHGGICITETPSTEGRGAFQDPSHVAFYNENSFWYLTQAALFRSMPILRARLQVSRIHDLLPERVASRNRGFPTSRRISWRSRTVRAKAARCSAELGRFRRGRRSAGTTGPAPPTSCRYHPGVGRPSGRSGWRSRS